jgi:hypothetical protein
MHRGRLLLLGLGVTVLLALAAIATSGKPLSASRGAGPSASFFDYVFTTIVIVAVAMTLVVLYAMTQQRFGSFTPHRRRLRLLSTLISMLIVGAAVLLFLHSDLGKRLRDLNARANPAQPTRGGRRAPNASLNTRNAHVRWDEIAVVLVLVAGSAVLLYAGRGARRTARPWRLHSKDAVSLAIIAAYARMERALAAGGIPRRPSEAPFEYVERALGDLDTSAASARRLTDLFEWAKFSQHEPGPEMRDEAIDALVAVRDELRRPVEAAVA